MNPATQTFTKLSNPSNGTEVIREGWFYGHTYLQGEYGDAYRKPEQRSPKATLFVTRCQERQRSGKPFVRCERTVINFPDDDAMVAWIEEHDAQELPPEADGNPQYVPEAFR